MFGKFGQFASHSNSMVGVLRIEFCSQASICLYLKQCHDAEHTSCEFHYHVYSGQRYHRNLNYVFKH